MNKFLTLLASVAILFAAGVQVSAQERFEVKGVVVDQLGPVIGAAVIEVGTSNGTSTGLDGDYVLSVSGADALVEVSCIGYATQTITVGSESVYNVVLQEDTQLLEDINNALKSLKADGTVKIPEALRPYMGGKTVITSK